jgi:hypothetical protein
MSVQALRTQYQNLIGKVANELTEIKSLTATLQSEIETLSKERDSIGQTPHKLQEGRVKLDVGGHHFSTTLDTLTRVPDSNIGRMFSGRFPVQVNDDGRIFIDRDGTYFQYILNYLRDPEGGMVKLKDKEQMDELKIEIEYFGLTQAVYGNVDLSTPDALDWIDNNNIKVHSFSSQLSGFPATNVLNPSTTYWLSDNIITDQWIVFEFPSKAFVNKIMIKVDSFECTAKDWMVQVTDDDEPTSEWNTVKEFQAKSGHETTGEQFFEEFEVRAKYMRLFFKNNWGPGGGTYILVTLIKFFGGLLED